MKHYENYERAYFMPPECTYDWVKKDIFNQSTDLVLRRFKRWKSGINRANESGRKNSSFFRCL